MPIQKRHAQFLELLLRFIETEYEARGKIEVSHPCRLNGGSPERSPKCIWFLHYRWDHFTSTRCSTLNWQNDEWIATSPGDQEGEREDVAALGIAWKHPMKRGNVWRWKNESGNHGENNPIGMLKGMGKAGGCVTSKAAEILERGVLNDWTWMLLGWKTNKLILVKERTGGWGVWNGTEIIERKYNNWPWSWVVSRQIKLLVTDHSWIWTSLARLTLTTHAKLSLIYLWGHLNDQSIINCMFGDCTLG